MAAVASGMTMRLLPKTTITFDKIQNSQTQTIMLCQHIDVSVFQEASFVVRGHSGTVTTGTSIVVNVLADGWTLEDPGLTLTNANDAAGAALGTATFPAGATFPMYLMLTVAKPSARLLSVSITGTQAGAAVACNIALSIDLTLKAGDPSNLPLDYNTYRGYRI